MPRKLDPNAVTPDIHWHPTEPSDERLCRDTKRILNNNDLTLDDLLRPLLTKERDDRIWAVVLGRADGSRAKPMIQEKWAQDTRTGTKSVKAV